MAFSVAFSFLIVCSIRLHSFLLKRSYLYLFLRYLVERWVRKNSLRGGIELDWKEFFCYVAKCEVEILSNCTVIKGYKIQTSFVILV